MEMQQIRYFLALTRTLNFTRAAEECNVSQSALTRAIQALEGELGGALIRREHSKSHLTELGKRMLPLMERCFESATTAKALARSISQSDVAPLALAISNSVSVELVMAPIAEVFRTLPGLQLRLEHGDGDRILELLKNGEVDLAVAGPLTDGWDRLDRWPLFDEPFEAAVRSDHPLAAENVITLEKLKPHPIFVLKGCESRPASARIFEARGMPSDTVHELAALDDLSAVVAQGIGVAIFARSTPRRDDMRRLPIEDLPLTRTVYAYAVSGRKRETAAGAFLSLLRNSEFTPA
ncbi:MAG: LysR family transcriptional regulator [Alphaproteobacteria bacterium]|nr:LysR family transcriptional regulator [Alphaproteobacteria bacterium]